MRDTSARKKKKSQTNFLLENSKYGDAMRDKFHLMTSFNGSKVTICRRLHASLWHKEVHVYLLYFYKINFYKGMEYSLSK